MISKFAYYFEDDCKSEPYTSVQKRVWIYPNGQVRVDRKFESSGRENTDLLFSLQEFADAYPVLFKEIYSWMRENHYNIKDLEFPEHNDLVPIMKTCSACHKEKPATEFPVNDLSFDGTHKECCEIPRLPRSDDVYTSQGENITEVIERLHLELGRIPTEGETMAEMMRIRARNEMKKAIEEQNNVLEAGMGKRDQ